MGGVNGGDRARGWMVACRTAVTVAALASGGALASCMDARDFLEQIARHGGGHDGTGAQSSAMGGGSGAGTGGAAGASMDGVGGNAAMPGSGGSCGGGAPTCEVPGCGTSGGSPTLPAGFNLRDVWVGPAGEVWTVGDGGFVGRRAPDTGAWCWCAPAPPSSLSGVWGPDSDHLFVVGENRVLLRLAGGRWTRDFQAGGNFHAVTGTGASNVWLVGDTGQVARFDGSGWEFHDADPKYTLNAVWLDPTGVVRAGGNAPITGGEPGVGSNSEGVILRLTDAATSTWVVEGSFPQRGSAVVYGLSGTAPNDVWAVGVDQPSGAATGVGMLAHFDGATWREAASADLRDTVHQMRDVAAATPDAGATWFVGGRFAVRFDGATYTSSPDLNLAGAQAIDVRGDAMYAVGTAGVIMRWTSSGWATERARTPAPVDSPPL